MLAGCGGAPPAQPSLDVAYAGCIRAQPGPVCFLDDGARFRLWARSPDGAELSVSGPVEVVESQEIEGGRLFVVRALAPDGEAIVTASAPEGPERFVLAFRPTPPPSPAIAEAERLFGEGDLAGASDALDRGWGAIPPTELGPAWRVRGRLAAASGDPEAASESMREAIDAMRSAGWLHQSAGAVAELAYGLIYQTDRFSDARSLLEAESLHRDAPAEARYGLSYLRGLLAINTGDMRGALQHLGDSVDVARRLGLEAWRMSAEQPLAHQLQRVGRGAEAAAIFSRHRRELPPDLGPCDRASLLNNLAWNQLLIRESGDAFGSEGEDPTAWLLEAREAFRDRPCVETDERANVEMNLALAALHRGDPEQARGHLENAAALEERPNLRSRFWRIEIEARLAMASGQPAVALEKYRQLESLAADALASRTLWHSEAGQARALWALGDTQAALEAYENAERHLDAASLAVPIDSGREGFVDRGLQVTRHHLDLLVELGQVERAFVLARRARSRVLRSLHRHSRLSRLSVDEQQLWDAAIGAYRKERRAFDALSVEDWTLSVEQLQRRLHEREQERSRLQQALDAAFATLDTLSPAIDESLPALAGGEVRLLFFPVGRGWIGFAESARGVVARRLESVAPGAEASALGEALLGPFTAVLEGASSVRLLPFAWLRDVDLHALPVGGGPPLVERSPVVFGLDLPREAAAPPPGGEALIVADPTEDLAAARIEGRHVADQLQAPWSARRLEGHAATGSALRKWLPRADLFHYAGHGRFAGRGGWESALPLAGDSRLTVADILALERAPRHVVLSACETAKSTPGGQVESVTGLAQAFLTAGSRSVVAAVRPVEDRTAAALVRRYYAAFLAGASPPEALRQAQLDLMAQDPTADWASFRLLEP